MKKSQQSALRRLAVTALVTIACAGSAVTAQAAYIVNATEVGGDVVFAGSGSIDITAWTSRGSVNRTCCFVDPDSIIILGSPGSFIPVEDYEISAANISGPASIGPGTALVSATGGTGEYTSLFWGPTTSQLSVPAGYVSQRALQATMSFTGASFASLGLAPGAYVWTWGSGESADSYTLNVGTVPVPAAVWLFGSGLLGLVGVARRKKA